ncbi:MAG: magnesium/cobalt transporter CorA [Fibrobacterota bacterium]
MAEQNYPGQAVFIGQRRTERVSIAVTDYDAEQVREYSVRDFDEPGPLPEGGVRWIAVTGLHDTEIIRRAGEYFRLHSLVIEDILNTGQRPKLEEYENCLCVTVKLHFLEDDGQSLRSEQLSIIGGAGYVLTFQEDARDPFGSLRRRLREHEGRIRTRGADYLLYALLDAVVDADLALIESLGDTIEDIELEIYDGFDRRIISRITAFRRETALLLKSIRPLRELIRQLSVCRSPLIDERTGPFLSDLLDHATQARESVDFYRTMLADHRDLCNMELNNHLNEIMKFLTIFSAVFIPLTFIAGIYGTNFEHMPELQWRYSYFVFLGVLLCIAVGMILFFRRKRWL